MPEALICDKCGGPLNEDYVCTYCGTRYKKPSATNVTINVTNNFNAPTAPAEPEQPDLTPPEPEPEEQPPAPPEPEQPVTPTEPEPEQDSPRGGTNWVVLLLLLGASIGLIWYGLQENNDNIIFIGLVCGALFIFLSSRSNKRKDNDDK